MQFLSWFTLPCADITSTLGRVDLNALPDQMRMELFAGDMQAVATLKDAKGEFLDMCSWHMVFCKNKKVTSISWAYEVEDSFFFDDEPELWPGGTVHIQYIPYSVKHLTLTTMRMHGSLETARLPRGLETVRVGENKLTGLFDIAGLPRGLSDIRVNRNLLDGSLDIPKLPKVCLHFDAGSNAFSGTIDLSALPPSLQYFSVQRNSIQGRVDLSAMPVSLQKVLIDETDIAQETLIMSHVCSIGFDADKIQNILGTDGTDIIRKFRRGY